MAQFARPDSDIVQGTWANQTGGLSLWTVIDEVSADDSDWIQSAQNPSLDLCEVGLSDVTDPVDSSGHIVRYRYQKQAAAGRTIELRVRLLQGASEIASWIHSDIGIGWTQANQTLSAAEANAITDYTDLRFEFRGDVSGGGAARRAQVSWAELEVPSVAVDFGWFLQQADLMVQPTLVPTGQYAFVPIVAAAPSAPAGPVPQVSAATQVIVMPDSAVGY